MRFRNPFSRKRLGAELLTTAGCVILLSACCTSPIPPPSPVCAGFEDLTVGDTYSVGDTLTSAGVSITAGDFVFSNGGTTSNGFAEVGSGGLAGGSGNELEVNNITLQFDFGGPLVAFTLLFGEYGGNLNLEVNGDFANFDNFADIDGATIGGVAVNVPAGGSGNDTGELMLSGNISAISVGGQELWIDDVCGTLQ